MARKRGNGEGSIYQRPDGRWCTQLTAYVGGKRKRPTLYGKTRKEVADKLTKALNDRDSGLSFDAENLRLDDYLHRWLEDSKKGSVKPVTYQGYERMVRNHLVPTLGRIKLKALTPTHLRGLYRQKTDAALSALTVEYIRDDPQRPRTSRRRWPHPPQRRGCRKASATAQGGDQATHTPADQEVA